MGFSFRKSIKIGPFRTTLTHRGITNSVGAGGLRYSKSARFVETRARNQDLIGGDGQPDVAPKGNPVVGFFVLLVIGFVIYKVFF